jgi:hypothetical protein
MGWFRSSEEKVLDRILDSCDDAHCDHQVGTTVMFGRRPSGTMRQVVRELRAGGMSVTEIIALVVAIFDLIQKIGPIVDEIVKRIRERRLASFGD